MNPERACDAVEAALRDYVKTRSSYRKDDKGQVWSQGMTIVSPDDKRIEEIARLVIEAVMRVDDKRQRTTVETRSLQLGDVFTRYAIKDGVAVDEEVTVIKVTTAVNRTTIRYRRPNDQIADVTIDASYLVSVVRPTNDDLRAMLSEAP
jgi:hypothetical protein